ncbi:MAG TPA: RelA/SpoT family protein [Nannocystaceae bacterium]|nr:RelA/SpoT family protein [Nannocystaceae bacterium]
MSEGVAAREAASEAAPDPTRLRAPEPGAPTPIDALGEPSAALRTGMITEKQLDDGSARAAIVAEVARRHPGTDTSAIERAFDLGMAAHSGQRRKSGEAYWVHPVRVASMLAQLGLDGSTVTAALLHDVVEDTEHTVYELTELFGREVANIVDGVTKLGKVPYLSRQEQQAESFRKMLVAMSQDIRVLLVKLIDRLDNMRTLEHMPRDKQERISRETMQIYAPLAGRLGIEVVQRELQDLSFSYLEPGAYTATRADIDNMLKARAVIDESVVNLRSAFDNSSCELEDGDTTLWPAELGAVDIRASLRSTYRVHQSLAAQGRGLDQLSDVVTYQIVTQDRGGCYAALGQLHAFFQPVPGRFRDYVALPRPNHYRALHTSVIDRHGNRLEVQIRSQRMDAVAERGIVAEFELDHALGNEARRLAWLRQLMDWQQEVSDPSEFIEAVKADLFADEVYVFTPGGDIQTFPKGATPIDFAFAIHTDVGMHCTGARVNGQLVPLRYRLRQGDTVEILTNPTVEPRDEWLKMAATSRARAKIKQFLRQRERKRLRALGRSLLAQELETRGVPLEPLEDAGALAEQAEAMGLPRETVDDGMYEAIGAGQITAAALADKLAPGPSQQQSGGEESGLFVRMLRRMTQRGRSTGGETLGAKPNAPIVITKDRVEGRGGSRGMIQLAPCCSPVPGDPLIGFFEAGKGIVAHVQGCPEALEQIGERRVHLAWEPGLVLDCPVTLEVRTANTLGLLAEMSRAFSHHGVNIKQANCRAIGDGERAINTFFATVHSLEQLESLVATLKRTEGVGAVERVFSQGSGIYPRA